MITIKKLIFLALFFCAASQLSAQSVPNDFIIENAASGASFFIPTAIAFSPDGRIFVAEKRGRIYIIENGAKLSTPFLDLEDEILDQGDRGLLGIAIDPNFESNSYVYLLYGVDPNGDGKDQEEETFGRLTRYKASVSNPNRADMSTRQVLIGATWSTGIPSCHTSHGPGSLRFGQDGSLLISSGDATPSSGKDKGGNHPACFGPGQLSADQDIGVFRAQYLKTLAGKILRIDPATGLGLPSNPYYTGNPDDFQSRVWAYGLRNPFRFAVRANGSANPNDAEPGTLFIGDVGWGQYEEMNLSKSGGGENFGWPCYEGPREVNQLFDLNPDHNGCGSIGTAANPADTTQALLHWHHTDPGKSKPSTFTGSSVTSGDFYIDNKYPGKYRNGLFFGDFVEGWLKVLKVNGSDSFERLFDFGENLGGIVDIQAHPLNGDIHYVDIFTGTIFRIRYTAGEANQAPVAVASAQPAFGQAPLPVRFTGSSSFDPDGDQLNFLWDFGNGDTSNARDPLYTYNTSGVFTARLTVRDPEGAESDFTLEIIVGGAPPQATILSPQDGASIFAAETVILNATAFDPDEPESQLQFHWDVGLHHNLHTHPSTFVFEERTGTFVPGVHGAPWDLLYLEIVLRVTDSTGLSDTARSYLVLKVEGEDDITNSGTPIAFITNPSGSGNPNLGVIKDNVSPPEGSSDPSLQYDTFTDGSPRPDDWIGYEFNASHRFSKIIFQEGMHFPHGGWFDNVAVEIRKEGAWQEALFLNSVPPYPANNGVNFETTSLLFSPMVGDAIRIKGTPGGDRHFISVGELRVIETPTGLAVTTPNGGESWTANSSQVISWASNGPVDNITIEFSADGGGSWKPVVVGGQNNGSYVWTAPDLISNACLIRIFDTTNPAIADTSDALFGIVESVARNYALRFDGVNDFVEIADSPVLGGGPGKSITVEAWINPTDVSAHFPIVQKWLDKRWKDWGITIDAGTLSVTIETHGDDWEYEAGNVSEDVWTHVAFTYDDATKIVQIYKDGEEVGPGAFRDSMPDTRASVFIGRHSYKDRFFPGRIDEVRIWNRAKSASEIQSLRHVTLNGNEIGLLGYWNFNEGEGSVADDGAGNGNAGRLNGPDWVESPVPTNGGSSVESVQVLSPNGGESWEEGNSHFVTWTASAAISNVKIEFSANGGASWTPVQNSTQNDGSYQWTVSDAPTHNGLIRISDAADGTPMDMSDGEFAIEEHAPDFHPPIVFSFNPKSGQPGTEVTLSGHDFIEVTDVSFNGNPALTFSMDSPSLLRVTVPANATTGKIQVTNTVGSGVSASDFSVLPSSGSLSFIPIHDSFVRSGKPNKNYGSSHELRVRRTSSSKNFIFLKFAITGLGGAPLRARLRLHVIDGSDDGGAIYSVSNQFADNSSPWREAGLRWDNAPGIRGTALSTVAVVNVGDAVEFDVTPAVRGDGTYSFGIQSHSSNVARYSTKEGVVSPELIIETSGGSANAPEISSFTPSSGRAGLEVTISGRSFTGVTDVSFHGVPATTYQVISDHEIQAVVPAGAATGKIRLTHAAGFAFSQADFTVTETHGILFFIPTDDAFVRSSKSGKNYGSASELRVRRTSADIHSYFKFSITGTGGPPLRARLLLQVIDASNDGGAVYSVSNQFADSNSPWTEEELKWVNAPEIDGAALSSVAAVNADETVEFDVTAAISGDGTYSFGIKNASSDIAKFSSKEGVVAPQLIVETGSVPVPSPSPVVTTFNPVSGLSGAEVTLTGAHFTGATVVTFNGSAASFSIHSDTEIRVSVPTGATTGKISVQSSHGAGLSTDDFVIPVAPAIHSFTPSSGLVGTEVTLNGSGFAGVFDVTFNGEPAASFVLNSSTQLRAVVPSGATSGKMSIENVAGSAVSSDDFTVTAPSGTLSFIPTDDVFVQSHKPDKNYGLNSELRVRHSSSSDRNSYLKFTFIGLGGPPQRATLRLHVLNGSSDGGSIYSVSNLFADSSAPWTESALTWNNAPEITGSPLSTASRVDIGELVEFDVTLAIAGDGIYSFAIQSGSNDVAKYSSRQGLVIPEIVVDTASTAATLAKSSGSDRIIQDDTVDEPAILPESLLLKPNYPNPFNIETTLEYGVPDDGQVRIAVYNLRGQLVRELVNEKQKAGFKRIRWNGRNGDDNEVSSGVYIVQLVSQKHKVSQKIILQK